jgi:D-alanine-D-alanine ligase
MTRSMSTDIPIKKIRVGVLFGGKSAEHEVSIQSARNVIEALDKTKFDALPIYIDKQGVWSTSNMFLSEGTTQSNHKEQVALTLLPGNKKCQLVSSDTQRSDTLDVIFPVLHGPLGEDGSIQGFLDLANVPYVGPGILGSAIGMDKDVMKRLLDESGVPVARRAVIRRAEQASIDPDSIITEFGLPLFVKPANMGSSIGVGKARTKQELMRAIDEAFHYDRKILVETAIIGDEVECAILGNEAPEVSLPGRIVSDAEFYDYQEKYQDTGHTSVEIPAKLPGVITEKVRQIAVRTFQALECEGIARVDMFVTKNGEVIVNEINTIPGFTKFSMYPKLWEATGVGYTAAYPCH